MCYVIFDWLKVTLSKKKRKAADAEVYGPVLTSEQNQVWSPAAAVDSEKHTLASGCYTTNRIFRPSA